MKFIETKNAPTAIGPYSQAVVSNGYIYVSGQLALNAHDGSFDPNQSIENQTELVLKNLEAILIAANSKRENIVKTTIYITSMNDFPVVNQVYNSFLGNHFPARATVEVSRLPKDALIEIDCIAEVA